MPKHMLWTEQDGDWYLTKAGVHIGIVCAHHVGIAGWYLIVWRAGMRCQVGENLDDAKHFLEYIAEQEA